ncbi:alpha/beta hydrolase [Novosphingobium sp. BL-8A]|uniref:alpha/beta hydrolase n=1 Tax=Novosphingobium sp. BL-8A TaxID=3127639 RepID=UPI0037582F58
MQSEAPGSLRSRPPACWWSVGVPDQASVRGAFLVSLPGPTTARFPKTSAADFVGAAKHKLGFSSFARNDPYGSCDCQRDRAAPWDNGFVDVGDSGHIGGSDDRFLPGRQKAAGGVGRALLRCMP